MPKSSRAFSRWVAHDKSTWAFQVFRKYNDELAGFRGSNSAAQAYTYHTLKNNKAEWSDGFGKHFPAGKLGYDYYNTIKNWSESYNNFQNWVNLSSIMSISSNLETYMASVVALAIDSDPGVLLGYSRAIDGIAILKLRRDKPHHLAQHIEACTKGDWSKRLAAFESLFGACPSEMRKHHGELEEIREIRNRFGHAFGRDIEESRKHGSIKITPIEGMKDKSLTRLYRAAWGFSKAMDSLLLDKHIGDFEALNFYSNIYPSQHKHVPLEQRAVNFKKQIGRFGAGLRGKNYCNELVAYWESL